MNSNLRCGHLVFPAALAFPLLLALPPQQLAVNLGDFFQLIFQLVVVLDPATDLFHFLRGNDAACGTPAAERHGEVPDWPMTFPFGAFACWISAGHIPFHQRSPQDVGDRRKLLGQTLTALA